MWNKIWKWIPLREQFKKTSRLEFGLYITWNKSATIRQWFWRNWKDILNNEHFDEYLNKFKKDEK